MTGPKHVRRQPAALGPLRRAVDGLDPALAGWWLILLGVGLIAAAFITAPDPGRPPRRAAVLEVAVPPASVPGPSLGRGVDIPHTTTPVLPRRAARPTVPAPPGPVATSARGTAPPPPSTLPPPTSAPSTTVPPASTGTSPPSSVPPSTGQGGDAGPAPTSTIPPGGTS